MAAPCSRRMIGSPAPTGPPPSREAEVLIREHGIEALTTPAAPRRPVRLPGLTFGRLVNDGTTRTVDIWIGAAKVGLLESVAEAEGGWTEWTGADCDDDLDGLRAIFEARLADAKSEARTGDRRGPVRAEGGLMPRPEPPTLPLRLRVAATSAEHAAARLRADERAGAKGLAETIEALTAVVRAAREAADRLDREARR